VIRPAVPDRGGAALGHGTGLRREVPFELATRVAVVPSARQTLTRRVHIASRWCKALHRIALPPGVRVIREHLYRRQSAAGRNGITKVQA